MQFQIAFCCFSSVSREFLYVALNSFKKHCSNVLSFKGRQGRHTWSRDCTVVRALASHQCGPGSIPGLDVICGLSLLLVPVLVPGGFFRVLWFSSLHKNQHFQIPIRCGIRGPQLCQSSDYQVSPSLNKVDLFIYFLNLECRRPIL